jgi:hypothetical protein
MVVGVRVALVEADPEFAGGRSRRLASVSLSVGLCDIRVLVLVGKERCSDLDNSAS